MNKLEGLIIRNDHDELLILLERMKWKDQIIINYDRHSDYSKNAKIDNGSWGYYGKQFGIIQSFIWIPVYENMLDWFRIKIAKLRMRWIRKPIILSLCYDYFIGLGLETDEDKIERTIDDILNDVRRFGLSILFVYASRSPEWSQNQHIPFLDYMLVKKFQSLNFSYSPLSQRPLLGKKNPPDRNQGVASNLSPGMNESRRP